MFGIKIIKNKYFVIFMYVNFYDTLCFLLKLKNEVYKCQNFRRRSNYRMFFLKVNLEGKGKKR